MNKKQVFILSILAAVNFTNILDFMVMMPLGPQLKRVFAMSPQDWSFLVSSYSFTAFVSGVFSIFFIDRIDRKKFLLFSFAGLILSTFLCAQADSFQSLVLARMVAGAFGGVVSSAILAMVGDLVSLPYRARAMGIVMLGFSLAAAVGVPIGIAVGASFSWRVPFVGLSILCSGLWVLSFFYVPSMPLENRGFSPQLVWKNIQLVFSDLNKNLSLLFFSLLVFSQFLVIPFLSPFLVYNIQFTEMQLMYIYLFGGSATLISSPWLGKWADKNGRIKTFVILAVLSVIPTYLITQLEEKNLSYIILLSILFFVFIGGRTIPAMSLVISTCEPSIRGTFMSIRSAFQMLVSGLAAYVAGQVIVEDAHGLYLHYDLIGYVSMLCCLLTIPLVVKIKERF